MTTLQQLRSRIGELVPDVNVNKNCFCDKNNCIHDFRRDPSLADCILAIERNSDYSRPTNNELSTFVSLWNLSKPLSGQSQETLDFIGDLIK